MGTEGVLPKGFLLGSPSSSAVENLRNELLGNSITSESVGFSDPWKSLQALVSLLCDPSHTVAIEAVQLLEDVATKENTSSKLKRVEKAELEWKSKSLSNTSTIDSPEETFNKRLSDAIEAQSPTILAILMAGLQDPKLRSACLRTMIRLAEIPHVYSNVVDTMASTNGLSNRSAFVREECADIVPFVFHSSWVLCFGSTNINYKLVLGLVRLLEDEDTNVVEASIRSLKHLNVVDPKFPSELQLLSRYLYGVYSNHITPSDSKRDAQHHYKSGNSDVKTENKEEKNQLNKGIESEYDTPLDDQSSSEDEEKTIFGLSNDVNNLNHARFGGVLDGRLLDLVTTTLDPKQRLWATNRIIDDVSKLSKNDLEKLRQFAGPYLEVLSDLLNERGAKLSQTTLRLVEVSVSKLGPTVEAYIHHLLPGLVSKLDESKEVVRDLCINSVFSCLIRVVGPCPLFRLLVPYLASSRSKVREGVLAVLERGLTVAPEWEVACVDLDDICVQVSRLLTDQHQQVVKKAVEVCVTIDKVSSGRIDVIYLLTQEGIDSRILKQVMDSIQGNVWNTDSTSSSTRTNSNHQSWNSLEQNQSYDREFSQPPSTLSWESQQSSNRSTTTEKGNKAQDARYQFLDERVSAPKRQLLEHQQDMNHPSRVTSSNIKHGRRVKTAMGRLSIDDDANYDSKISTQSALRASTSNADLAIQSSSSVAGQDKTFLWLPQEIQCGALHEVIENGSEIVAPRLSRGRSDPSSGSNLDSYLIPNPRSETGKQVSEEPHYYQPSRHENKERRKKPTDSKGTTANGVNPNTVTNENNSNGSLENEAMFAHNSQHKRTTNLSSNPNVIEGYTMREGSNSSTSVAPKHTEESASHIQDRLSMLKRRTRSRGSTSGASQGSRRVLSASAANDASTARFHKSSGNEPVLQRSGSKTPSLASSQSRDSFVDLYDLPHGDASSIQNLLEEAIPVPKTSMGSTWNNRRGSSSRERTVISHSPSITSQSREPYRSTSGNSVSNTATRKEIISSSSSNEQDTIERSGAGSYNIDFDAIGPDSNPFDVNGTCSSTKPVKRMPPQVSNATLKRREQQQKQFSSTTPSKHPPGNEIQRVAAKSRRNSLPPKLSATERIPGKVEKKYLTRDEILSFTIRHPEQEFKAAITALQGSEWDQQFDALDTLRKLALNNSQVVEAELHTCVLLVLKTLDNLRSSVSKNSLLTLKDFLYGLGKQMDPEIDTFLPAVVRKACDTNAFLGDEAEEVVNCMIKVCNDNRVLLGMLNCNINKSALYRAKHADMLSRCVGSMGSRVVHFRELDKLIQCAKRYVEDSSSAARSSGKCIVAQLHNHGAVSDKALRSMLSTRQYKELMDRNLAVGPGTSIKQHQHSGAFHNQRPGAQEVTQRRRNSTGSDEGRRGGKPTGVRTGGGRVRGRSGSQSSSQESTGKYGSSATKISDVPELSKFQDNLNAIQSSDWRARHQGLKELTMTVVEHPHVILQTQQVMNVVDQLCSRVSDGNSKVNTLALECLGQVVPLLHLEFDQQVWSLLMPVLCNNLVASNRVTQQLANQVVDEVLDYGDCTTLVHSLLHLLQFSNSKVKTKVLEKMAQSGILEKVFDTKRSILLRHVVPRAFELLDSAKGTARMANHSLLKELALLLGEDLATMAKSLPEHNRRKVNEIVDNA